VEISHREKVLLPAEPRTILDSYHVLSTRSRIPTMALPEIFAEKVRALCMRSQARDLFDLGFLVEKGVRPDAELIAAKLSWWRPGVRLDPETVADRIDLLEVTWERDLEPLVDRLPSFDKVASTVRASLARAMRRR
jgi:predicted nucleotidyltransferase component of viral defense system